MRKYAIVVIGLLVLAGCKKIDDIGVATAVPTSTAKLIEATEAAVPLAYPAPVTAASSPTPAAAYPVPALPPTPSPSPVSNQSNGDSFQPRISADGQTISFLSAGSLTLNDNSNAFSIFVRNRISQTTTLVNAGFVDYLPQSSVYGAAMSANGRVVAYYSFESDLVPGDEMDCGSEDRPMSCEDLFIHDRDTGLTERIPLGRGQGLGGDYTLALSGDGRFVAYGSTIYDWETGRTETIPTQDGQPPNGYTFAPQFAVNGDLAFVSRADNLIPGGDDDAFDVFVWERPSGQIIRISAGNADSGMSSTGEGFWGELAISGNGSFIAYASIASNLTADPVNECDDFRGYARTCYHIYLHDRDTGQTNLITQNSNGDSTRPGLSGDGRFTAFTSIATNLTDDELICDFPAIINCGQVYLYDTQTGQTTLISRALDGTPGNQASYQAVISENGRFIAYTSQADNLVPDDTNDVSDIFVYDQESGQTERISLAYNGPVPDPLPDINANDLAQNLIFQDVADSDAPLQRLRTSPYGLRYTSYGYCEHGPYRWLDNDHLLLFPVVGYTNWFENPTGGQVTQPIVMNLNGDAWLAGSPPTDRCDVPVWSSALERLIEAGDGEVRLRDLSGVVTAVYAGDYPLNLAPSGRRLLANLTWIDLDSGETISFPGNERVKFVRPAWTADERRFFECCFGYGDVETGDYWQRSALSGFWVGGIGVGPGHTGSESHWVADGTRILVNPNAIHFQTEANRPVVPLIDPVSQTYEDMVERLDMPESVINCFSSAAPGGSHFWLGCVMLLEDDFNIAPYPTSYLVELPSWETIPITGSLEFHGWSGDGRFLTYNQFTDTETHTGITWLVDTDGSRRQIADEAAQFSTWHPFDPVVALRFDDGRRIQIVHAENGDSREVVFNKSIKGLVWQPGGTSAAVWDEDGRIYQLSDPLNPASVLIPLTPPLPDVHTVRWSTGTRLAFVSGMDLYVVEAP